MIDITGSSDTFCPEAVRDNWEKLTDFEGENIELKPSVQSGGTMTQILQIMQNGGADNAAPAEKKKSSGGAGLRSAAVFDRMKDQIGPDVVKRMKGVIAFNVTNGKGGATGTWVVDLKSGNGSITFLEKGKKSPKRADMTLTIADKDLVDMANGDLNGQSAFMSGKLKLKGNMGLAMKLETLFRSTAKL
jgi:alkyl sulfatase BDS1-like metallo-beta-lactamase superfamily hydrolase